MLNEIIHVLLTESSMAHVASKRELPGTTALQQRLQPTVCTHSSPFTKPVCFLTTMPVCVLLLSLEFPALPLSSFSSFEAFLSSILVP